MNDKDINERLRKALDLTPSEQLVVDKVSYEICTDISKRVFNRGLSPIMLVQILSTAIVPILATSAEYSTDRVIGMKFYRMAMTAAIEMLLDECEKMDKQDIVNEHVK